MKYRQSGSQVNDPWTHSSDTPGNGPFEHPFTGLLDSYQPYHGVQKPRDENSDVVVLVGKIVVDN